jgi:hypothetical protein
MELQAELKAADVAKKKAAKEKKEKGINGKGQWGRRKAVHMLGILNKT